MFRGKESSNRIELSRLVQDLLKFWCFGLPAALGVGGLGIWGWGVVGGCPSHMCTRTRMHARTTHAHACMVNMIIPCKWLPPLDLGKSQGFPMMSYVRVHACACVHACAHVWGDPVTTPTHIHPPPHPPGWGPPGISQNSIALELIEIFQFCLKI